MSGWKIFWSTVGIFVLIGVVTTVIGFANNWGRTAVDVVSPDNVKKQHEQIIGKYNSMIAAADNVCTVSKSSATDASKAPTLVENSTTAYQSTFRNIVTDYNSSMENIFKAKIVAPEGYPKSVPLSKLDTKDWCTVSDQIRALN